MWILIHKIKSARSFNIQENTRLSWQNAQTNEIVERNCSSNIDENEQFFVSLQIFHIKGYDNPISIRMD